MKRLSLVLAIGFAAGCGGDGGSGGGALPGLPQAVADTTFEVEKVPTATAAAAAVEEATQATTNEILDTFTQGEATQAPHVFLAPPVFEFTYHVEKEIDYDSLNRNGSDRFPNLSGVVEITVDGLLAGTWLEGEASYMVLVQALTDVEAVNPGTDVVTLIPEGSFWAYALEVTWAVTDAQNWIVVATSTRSIDVEGLTVTDGDQVTTVSVVGAREVVSAIAKIEGEVVRERTITGSVTITVDDGEEETTIVLEYQEDNLILVTINGEEFGPFTPQEFREFFGCNPGNGDEDEE
jgi:hypothetical protein